MRKFYHVTLAENVPSLLAKGADPSQIGVNSLKAGPGFHLTRKYEWAEEWGHELFSYPSPPETTILQVALEDAARFASDREKPERRVLERWGKAQGYLEKDGSPSSKLLQVAHEENWPEDSDYFIDAMDMGVPCALMGRYLTAQGFDGYWVDNGNSLVVTNFSLLASDAFTRATGIHHQMVTIQDAASGHFLTLKLSPGANGLMVYCYPDEQTSGQPLASFQVASYNHQLEILYWDAAMSDAQDPKRIVLAEHIPPQSQGDDQLPEADTLDQ